MTEALITVPKGKLLLERNIRHISHGKCMDEVRARNSHHQGVIQASKQQRKYAAGLLCIISEFSMCAPCAPRLMYCRHAEKNWISFLPVVLFAMFPFSLWVLTHSMPHYQSLCTVHSAALHSFLFHMQMLLTSHILVFSFVLFYFSFLFWLSNISVSLSSIAQPCNIIYLLLWCSWQTKHSWERWFEQIELHQESLQR